MNGPRDERDAFISDDELSLMEMGIPLKERELALTQRPPAPVPFYHPNPVLHKPLFSAIPRRREFHTSPYVAYEPQKDDWINWGSLCSRYTKPVPLRKIPYSFSNIGATGHARHYIWHRIINRFYEDDESPNSSNQSSIRGLVVHSPVDDKEPAASTAQ